MKHTKVRIKDIVGGAGAVFNIVRKQRGQVAIIHRELPRHEAVTQITNLKRRARDAHSNVYFDMVEVPYELTAKGMAEAAEKRRLAEEMAAIEEYFAMQDAKVAACEAAGTADLEEDNFCLNCGTFHHARAEAAA